MWNVAVEWNIDGREIGFECEVSGVFFVIFRCIRLMGREIRRSPCLVSGRVVRCQVVAIREWQGW